MIWDITEAVVKMEIISLYWEKLKTVKMQLEKNQRNSNSVSGLTCVGNWYTLIKIDSSDSI